MLNGDTYVPFLLKMLANPSGPPSPGGDHLAGFCETVLCCLTQVWLAGEQCSRNDTGAGSLRRGRERTGTGA